MIGVLGHIDQKINVSGDEESEAVIIF